MIDLASERRGGERGAESMRNVPVFVPLADHHETERAHVLILEMPGIDPDSLSVTLEKRVLTVTGRGRPEAPEGYSLAHREFREGDYERAFTIAETIDSDRIEAELRDGLLRLTLPKSEPAPAKTIHVKGA
jgi:HSP20 family protein